VHEVVKLQQRLGLGGHYILLLVPALHHVAGCR